jgi:hypothetical protein
MGEPPTGCLHAPLRSKAGPGDPFPYGWTKPFFLVYCPWLNRPWVIHPWVNLYYGILKAILSRLEAGSALRAIPRCSLQAA